MKNFFGKFEEVMKSFTNRQTYSARKYNNFHCNMVYKMGQNV